MKIIAGKYKGRNFFMPGQIRPTQNIVRKALFDLLGQDLEGLTFLELFAGSGAIGLEALSRGAQKCTFVERDEKCAELIERNAKSFNLQPASSSEGTPAYEIIQEDTFVTIKRLAGEKRKFDIIFLDPPYGVELAKKALKTLGGYGIVHPASVVVVQHNRREKLPAEPDGFRLVQEKQYGSSVLSIYHCKSEPLK